MTDIHRGFQDADQAAEAEAFFAFLDAANELESIRAYRKLMLELAPVHSGDRILDVGCGVGHSALELAKEVETAGAVVGVDKSEALIAEATRRAEKLCSSATYLIGDGCRLDFPDDCFDICRTERVLMYVDRPETAVDEMVRVLRRGGRFALFEFDYDCIVIDAEDAALTRRILRLVSDSIPSPRIGRQLRRQLIERGAADLTVVPHMVATPLEMFRGVVGGTVGDAAERGELEAAQIDQWWRDLERAEADGHFFAGFFGFVVTGKLVDKG